MATNKELLDGILTAVNGLTNAVDQWRQAQQQTPQATADEEQEAQQITTALTTLADSFQPVPEPAPGQ